MYDKLQLQLSEIDILDDKSESFSDSLYFC